VRKRKAREEKMKYRLISIITVERKKKVLNFAKHNNDLSLSLSPSLLLLNSTEKERKGNQSSMELMWK
jgi:hypothetical protein